MPGFAEAGWQYWFLWLSGWPVFLTTIAITFVFMLVASVVLTWISNRSVAHSIALGVLAVAMIAALLLAGTALLTRAMSY